MKEIINFKIIFLKSYVKYIKIVVQNLFIFQEYIFFILLKKM